ncbi:MAG: hypothetical protein OXH54_01120 [Acidimicrobiaceae bacterium]|nr:hypothetical protein [Acidimicrobiaceae bacterium]
MLDRWQPMPWETPAWKKKYGRQLPTTWDFWVIPAQTLDDQLGAQKTVRPTTLKRLARRIEWSQIKAAVDRLID